jgi:hypothetical protein
MDPSRTGVACSVRRRARRRPRPCPIPAHHDSSSSSSTRVRSRRGCPPRTPSPRCYPRRPSSPPGSSGTWSRPRMPRRRTCRHTAAAPVDGTETNRRAEFPSRGKPRRANGKTRTSARYPRRSEATTGISPGIFPGKASTWRVVRLMRGGRHPRPNALM